MLCFRGRGGRREEKGNGEGLGFRTGRVGEDVDDKEEEERGGEGGGEGGGGEEKNVFTDLLFHPRLEVLLTGTTTTTTMFDLRQRKEILSLPESSFGCVRFSPCGRWVITGERKVGEKGEGGRENLGCENDKSNENVFLGVVWWGEREEGEEGKKLGGGELC